MTGHATAGQPTYKRFCIGCHGELEMARAKTLNGSIRSPLRNPFGVWSKDVLSAGPAGARLTRAEIRARLNARTIGQQGNGTLEQNNIRAAVLVPLVERADGWFVVLTLRSADLADHAGQISLPGGRIEPEDVSPMDAALREAEEEIGLSRDYVELAGRLDTWLTGTGFEVTPIVGRCGRRRLMRPIRSRSPKSSRSRLLSFSTSAITNGARASLPASSVFSGRSPIRTATSGARPPACWSISPKR